MIITEADGEEAERIQSSVTLTMFVAMLEMYFAFVRNQRLLGMPGRASFMTTTETHASMRRHLARSRRDVDPPDPESARLG